MDKTGSHIYPAITMIETSEVGKSTGSLIVICFNSALKEFFPRRFPWIESAECVVTSVQCQREFADMDPVEGGVCSL